MIRLFACDMDGTLLNAFHQMDRKIRKAIDMTINNDCYFVLASGRNFHSKAMKRLKLENTNVYSVGCNGAIVKNGEKEIIYSKSMNVDLIDKLHNLIPSQPLRIHQYDKVFILYDNPFFSIKGLFKYYLLKLVFQSKGKYRLNEVLTKEVHKVDIPLANKKQKRIVDNFLEEYKNDIVDAKSFLGTYEITDSSVNKGTGLEQLINYLNVKREEVTVYGDHQNDIEMMRLFPNSAAPKNCHDIVKPFVKRYVASNYFHGVSNDIIHIIQGQKEA